MASYERSTTLGEYYGMIKETKEWFEQVKTNYHNKLREGDFVEAA